MESKPSARSRLEELKERRRKRREEMKERRKRPEKKDIISKLDEIVAPRMKSDTLAPSMNLRLDTFSLKEYFRHRRKLRVTKKSQAVQTDKEFEEVSLRKAITKMETVRHRKSTKKDDRKKKTIMGVIINFTRSLSKRDDEISDSRSSFRHPRNSLARRLTNKSNNPFRLGQPNINNIKIDEEEEDDFSVYSFYSDEEDARSVQSADLGRRRRQRTGIREMSPEKALKVIKSKEFKEYFMESSRYLEKVLDLKKGLRFRKIYDRTSPIEAEITLGPAQKAKDWFVGDLQWSPFVPSVFLTSYFNKEEEDPSRFKDYVDLIHIWNVTFPSRPEKELVSSSKIQTVKFHPLASECILAGFESGMVGLFDLRASKEPVLKSKVHKNAHKSTITCLDLLGNKNSNFLITGSEDGRICQWDLAKLDSPTVHIDLGRKQFKKTDEDANFHYQIEPMSISHVHGESDFVYMGDIDTHVHQISTQKLGQPHERPHCLTESFTEHRGPVNVITHNRVENTPAFHGLMLTGSFDWNIKLWNPKSDNTSKMTYTYHSDEITDLSFSSENPYLFASCDSAGLLCLNTLYNDQEEPLFKTKLDFPLFNAKWDNSGKMLALSDDSGRIHLKRFRSGFFHYTQEKLSLLERILKK